MANGGWHGSHREWQRLEAPLRSIDPVLEEFAHAHGLELTKNRKEIPERSVRWGDNPSCLIQVYLEHDYAPSWNLWRCCSIDRGDSRYWREDTPLRNEPIEAFRETLAALLNDSYVLLEQWKAAPEQLEFATKLSMLS